MMEEKAKERRDMTKKKVSVESEFLPGMKYNPESNDFTVETTSVRPELMEEEIDRMDCAPEIKEDLKFTAKCNFDGKILSFFLFSQLTA